MDGQNGGCPLQRLNNISMLFYHNLGIDVDELIVYENAIVYGLQFSGSILVLLSLDILS